METDEELARKLQNEFDAEALLMEEREMKDAEMAQKLAETAHQISESEEKEEKKIGVKRKKMLKKKKEDLHVKARRIFKILNEEQREDGEEKRRMIEEEVNLRRSEISNQEHDVFDDEEKTEISPTSREKSMCKYGAKCYRKNPNHFLEFSHPQISKICDSGSSSTGHERNMGGSKEEEKNTREESENTQKKSKKRIKENGKSFASRLKASSPYNIFLNKCYSAKESQKDGLSLVFPDLLNPSLGQLVESAQLTFMADLDFLMSQYEAWKVADKPLLLAYGQMEGNKDNYPNLTCIKPQIPYQYGTHHTKTMLFLYNSGMRVVIHTANLVPNDWYEKTQGYWVSPLFPKLDKDKEGILEGESATYFKRDLIEYFLVYKCKEITRWVNIIKSHDFRQCRVVLIGSVPGYHTDQKNRWGHLKLRQALTQHTAPSSKPSKERPTTVIQCSSLGSLGKDSGAWLVPEFGHSLSTLTSMFSFKHPDIKVIYPSESDVKESSEGWMGGSCLPYNSNTHDKQTWINNLMCSWHSNSRGHTRSMPHIKTYTQVSSDLKEARFFLLTSANLSKAAWGCLQKQGTQLFIRSYELGVLLLPKFVTGNNEFTLSPSDLTLPYDLPLTPYSSSDSPWLMNTKKEEKDIHGNTYP